MATYHYKCTKDCKLRDLPDKYKEFITIPDELLVWEVEHSMHDDPDIRCPICGEKATRTMIGISMPEAYIRGYGYLDKAGCIRDMNLYKLNQGQDPYGHIRQPGEVDDIKDKLRKAGKHNPKRKTFI